jgi:hypothetical protein
MNKIFQSAPISSHFWLSMIAAMFSVFFIVEIEKALIKNER